MFEIFERINYKGYNIEICVYSPGSEGLIYPVGIIKKGHIPLFAAEYPGFEGTTILSILKSKIDTGDFQ